MSILLTTGGMVRIITTGEAEEADIKAIYSISSKKIAWLLRSYHVTAESAKDGWEQEHNTAIVSEVAKQSWRHTGILGEASLREESDSRYSVSRFESQHYEATV